MYIVIRPNFSNAKNKILIGTKMKKSLKKQTRGRPKKVDRNKILRVAMDSYWTEGIQAISLNEICRRTNTSKPGLYREFASEDGLMRAALEQYQNEVLSPLHNYLLSSLTIEDITQKLVTIMKSNTDRPQGCLFVKMMEVESHLGEQTKQALRQCHQASLEMYRQMAEKLIKNKSIASHLSPTIASKYLNTQINHASALLSRGENIQDVEILLALAFTALLH